MSQASLEVYGRIRAIKSIEVTISITSSGGILYCVACCVGVMEFHNFNGIIVAIMCVWLMEYHF